MNTLILSPVSGRLSEWAVRAAARAGPKSKRSPMHSG